MTEYSDEYAACKQEGTVVLALRRDSCDGDRLRGARLPSCYVLHVDGTTSRFITTLWYDLSLHNYSVVRPLKSNSMYYSLRRCHLHCVMAFAPRLYHVS